MADKKNIKYREPDNYIPDHIWKKYFNEDGSVKEETKQEETKKKPTTKKKKG